ncbi:MAG TPA: PQQ-binding-like beta-propeller repeat protein, partial [Caulobacteraceae bacterium]|nr:PQQ-binding-like beta-propeller repeat protein [Caulobacteraceae bacterium]
MAGLTVVGIAGAGASQSPQDVGASLFQGRCAGCHDPAVGRAPSREQLAQRAPESIVSALTTGAMRSFSSGLSPDMVRSVAVYLSGKPLAAAGAAPGAQPPDNKCATNPPIRAAATDWNGYGKTATSSRYQSGTTITPKNVDRLKVKWTFSVAGGRAGQPAIIGDRLFFTTWAGDAYSLDARTGCVYWRKAIGSPMRAAPLVVHKPGYSPSGWVMYLGDFNRDFRALDAMTGAELWKTNLETHPLSMLTGGPAIAGDRIYVPISSAEELSGDMQTYSCCTFGGKVAALDLKTGKVIWKTAVLDPKPTRKNRLGNQLYGPAGAAIWSQPTVDLKRGQLYVTTGDSYTEVDAPTADAVLAIGLSDGKIRWTTQTLKADNFLIGCPRGVNCPLGKLGPDVDYGSSPILFTLPGGKQVVMAGQKSGLVSAMDPQTGKTVWQTQVGYGSLFGGVEWGMAADNRQLYVAISDGAAPRDKARPGVYALDPATGKVNWETLAPRVPCGWGNVLCKNAQSAPATAIPGVV